MMQEDDELQGMVLAGARKIYSETVIDHFLHPGNLGEMKEADGMARITGPRWDTIQIWLKVNQGLISQPL
jgi:NifU-like protein involved in Fe-S cluster formation